MSLFRALIFLLLVCSGVAFAFYVFTGERKYLRLGTRILTWTVLAGLGFFAVLIVERMV